MSIKDYHLVLLAFYILLTSWFPLFNKNILHIDPNLNNHHLLYWPLTQCFVALAMILYVILSKKTPVTCNHYVWLFALLFCLPMDALWHMAYAKDKLLALALSFWYFGMFFMLLPTYFALAILGFVLLIAIILGFVVHNFLAIFMDNLAIFLPAVLFLASSMYMQKKYITKARQAQCFAAQQQKAIEQETHRTNMARYLDRITTEQFSQADILSKISTEQAQVFAHMDPTHLQHTHIADAMDKFIDFAVFLMTVIN